MSRRPARGPSLLMASAVAAAVAAGALSACGKKGELQPPPPRAAAKTALDESPPMLHADGRRTGRGPEAGAPGAGAPRVGTPWIISRTATASFTPRT